MIHMFKGILLVFENYLILFEKFRNKCFQIYELDLAYFLSAPELP